MTTLTPEQHQSIVDLLERTPNLSKGIGTMESPCSVAVINLAMLGVLTDIIPECMSVVVGKFIIMTQDAIPAEMRNSVQWRSLLPTAAGTGRDLEKERESILLRWMWGSVLPRAQFKADQLGYGRAWGCMISDRSVESVNRVLSEIDNCFVTSYASFGAMRGAAFSVLDSIANWNNDERGKIVYDVARVAVYISKFNDSDTYWRDVDLYKVLEELINVEPEAGIKQ
jgi:hypothetical protein